MTHRTVRRLAAAASVCLATVLLAAAPATATDVDKASQEVERLGREVEIAAEDYNEIRAQLSPLQASLAAAQARESQQQGVIADLRAQMTMLAVEAYKNGGVSSSVRAFLSGDPSESISGASTVEAVARRQNATFEDYTAAKALLEKDRAAVEAKLAEVGAIEADLAARKADIDQQLAGAEDILAVAQEKAAAEAAVAARAAAAQAATRSAARAGVAGTGIAAPLAGAAPLADAAPVSGGGTCGVTPPTEQVAKVLEYACAQLGKPYLWGAAGPNSFDCSGLTSMAWAAGGVSLPHSSRMQYSGGNKIEKSELRPGDLVFGFSPISHVGIYLGNNTMVAAPSSGSVVKIQSMTYIPYAGAVRPGGG